MPQYSYKAVDMQGEAQNGVLEAASRHALIGQLLDQGLTPITADEVKARETLSWARLLRVQSKPSAKDIGLFTQQLVTFLSAGLTIEHALKTFHQTAWTKPLKIMAAQLLGSVREGKSLSVAMETAAYEFPAFYLHLIAAGEISGALEQTLTRLGDYLEWQAELRERITSALIYPALLLMMIGATMFVVLTLVIPQFQPIFDDAGTSLPLPTQIVLGIGAFFGEYWWLMGLGLIAGVMGARALMKQHSIRLAVHRMFLRESFFFGALQKFETANLARTLGTLIANGLTITAAMAATRGTTSNAALEEALKDAQTKVQEGAKLSDPLAATRLLPPLFIQLVRVGEESGKLEPMLFKIAQIYEREVKTTLDRALALLVPLLTVLMGGIVAVFIGSIMVGIMSINQLAF